MRIALVGPSISQRGGIVSVLVGLAGFLRTKEIDVRIIATTTGQGRFSNFLCFFIACVSVITNGALRNLDVVHLHMASRGSCLRKSALSLICIFFRIPYIVHLHGGEFHVFFNEELSCVGRRYVRHILRRANYVITLTESWKAWVDSEVHGCNVRVVFNGVAPSVESSESRDLYPKTVLFLGRLCAEKGVGELIEAMQNVFDIVPSARLELGGDGDIAYYRQLSGHSSRIEFLGWLDHEARAAALGRAVVFCLPSRNEGAPMSVLEAMSAGLPVVSTRVGGLPELVEEGISGLLVAPRDTRALSAALLTVLCNPELASSMGLCGKKTHREKFSINAMGNRCLAIYQACIERRD